MENLEPAAEISDFHRFPVKKHMKKHTPHSDFLTLGGASIGRAEVAEAGARKLAQCQERGGDKEAQGAYWVNFCDTLWLCQNSF